jgi:CheY-like chemotaxis protein
LSAVEPRVVKDGTLATPTVEPTHRCNDHRVPGPVLIVDDDAVFLTLVARTLAELGVDAVATAADAAQALEVARESRPNAVLVDIGLPDRNGSDLAYQLAGLPWRPRVVLTSSDSEAFLAVEPPDGHRELPFIAKEELASDTLRRVLLDG